MTALWLLAAAVMVVLVVMIAISLTITGDNRLLRDELDAIKESLSGTQTVVSQNDALQRQLTRIHDQVDIMGSVETELAHTHVDWAAAMQVIGDYDPTSVTLQSIEQDGGQIRIRGFAQQQDMVDDYVDGLRQAGLFGRVEMESVSAVPGSSQRADFVIWVTLEAE